MERHFRRSGNSRGCAWQRGGTDGASKHRTAAAWRKGRESPVYYAINTSLLRAVYAACVRSGVSPEDRSSYWPAVTGGSSDTWEDSIRMTDRISSQQVANRCGQLLDVMRERRLRWYGHVRRRGQTFSTLRCLALVLEEDQERGGLIISDGTIPKFTSIPIPMLIPIKCSISIPILDSDSRFQL